MELRCQTAANYRSSQPICFRGKPQTSQKVPYARIKIGFDVTCLVITACMTFFCLGHIMGLGIGTIVAAFTMGKGIAIIGNWMDQRVEFVSLLS